MRLVVCPKCGHANRASVVVTLCDRCGEDISTAPAAAETPTAPPEPRPPVERVAVQAPPEAAPAVPAPRLLDEDDDDEGPRPSGLRVALSRLGRLMAAAVALGLGIGGSSRLPVGSALTGDETIAGSVAILAAAAGLSGLVILTVGSGSGRSHRMGFGLRAVGFILAVLGTLSAVALVHQPADKDQEATTSDAPTVAPSMPPGHSTEGGPGPRGAEPGPGFPPGNAPPGSPGPAPDWSGPSRPPPAPGDAGPPPAVPPGGP